MCPCGMPMQTLENTILQAITLHKRGWVFSPRHFVQLGDPRAIGVALTHLTRKGVIRRLDRGLYDYPRQHPKLGAVSPSVDAIADALSDRDANRLQPSGAYAANLLGLSDQVPMRVLFLAAGKTRKVKIGKLEIILKRAMPRNLAAAGRTSGLVIQALRHLGQGHVDESVVAKLRDRLSSKDKAQLLQDLRYAPAWIAAIMRAVAREKA